MSLVASFVIDLIEFMTQSPEFVLKACVFLSLLIIALSIRRVLREYSEKKNRSGFRISIGNGQQHEHRIEEEFHPLVFDSSPSAHAPSVHHKAEIMRSSSEKKRYAPEKKRSEDEEHEYRIIKYLVRSIGSHLEDLMSIAESGNCKDYESLISNWNAGYGRMRSLCIRNRLPNPLLKDRDVFVPTSEQLAMEEQLSSRFKSSCEKGMAAANEFHALEQRILDYLDAQKRHKALRRVMVNELAGDDPEEKKVYRRVCSKMVSNGVLSESHDDSGALVIMKKRARKKKPEPVVELPPSVFRSELYHNVDHHMLLKVKLTVGTPEHVNVESNQCIFRSLVTDELYHTSLEKCTCMSYQNGARPCKHMVALAQHLKYMKSAE